MTQRFEVGFFSRKSDIGPPSRQEEPGTENRMPLPGLADTLPDDALLNTPTRSKMRSVAAVSTTSVDTDTVMMTFFLDFTFIVADDDGDCRCIDLEAFISTSTPSHTFCDEGCGLSRSPSSSSSSSSTRCPSMCVCVVLGRSPNLSRRRRSNKKANEYQFDDIFFFFCYNDRAYGNK